MTRDKPGPDAQPPLPEGPARVANGSLIVVIDDDALVLNATSGLLKSWSYRVVAANSDLAALAGLAGQRPDLIISDYRLSNGKTGIEAVARLRGALRAAVPALLISGDTVPQHLRDLIASGHHLLHKPVTPSALRNVLDQLLES